MAPEALRRRMAHGNVYSAEKVDAALGNYFRVGNLTALRELALLWTADKVDEALQIYREQNAIEETWEARERVVVALTGGPEGETLIRRAARVAARSSGGDLLAVHVTRSDGLTGANPADLAAQRQLVETLGGTYHQVVGDDVPDALLEFARAENATQLVLGVSRRSRLAAMLTGPGIGADVIRHSGDIDVHLVTHHQMGKGYGLPRPARQPDPPPAAAGLRPQPAAPRAAHAGARARPAAPEPRERRPAVPAGGRGRGPGRRVRCRPWWPPSAGRCCSTTSSPRRCTGSPSARRTTSLALGVFVVVAVAGQLRGRPGRPAYPAGGTGDGGGGDPGHARRQRAAGRDGRCPPCWSGCGRRSGSRRSPCWS